MQAERFGGMSDLHMFEVGFVCGLIEQLRSDFVSALKISYPVNKNLESFFDTLISLFCLITCIRLFFSLLSPKA